jgi:hypothetical protein
MFPGFAGVSRLVKPGRVYQQGTIIFPFPTNPSSSNVYFSRVSNATNQACITGIRSFKGAFRGQKPGRDEDFAC